MANRVSRLRWLSGGLQLGVVLTFVVSALSSDKEGGDHALTSAAESELKILQMEYQQRLLKARAPADEWYRRQLRALLIRYQKAGDTELVGILTSELADPDPNRPLPGARAWPADLMGLRKTYVTQARNYTAPVEDWYRNELRNLERARVRAGDLEGAQLVRARIEAVTVEPTTPLTSRQLSLTNQWTVLCGGTIQGSGGRITLTGPGSGYGALQLAIALSPWEISRNVKVSGKIRIRGQAGGFALGRNEKDCVTVYWSRGTSWGVQHVGEERRILSRPALAWKPESWQTFEIFRERDDLIVKIDSTVDRIELPKGIGRYCFGVTTAYQPSAVDVDDIKIEELMGDKKR